MPYIHTRAAPIDKHTHTRMHTHNHTNVRQSIDHGITWTSSQVESTVV